MQEHRAQTLLQNATKKSKRVKLEELVGNEFIKLGNNLLRRRRGAPQKRSQLVGNVEDVDNEVTEPEETSPPPPRRMSRLRALIMRETRVFSLVYALIGCILWYGFAAFILLNINIINGYPSFRLPPSPGPFQTMRYGFVWSMFYLMWFNWLSPIMLLLCVILPRSRVILTFQFTVNLLLILANVIVFFVLLGIMIGYCNSWSSFGSPCNSPLNCCVNGGSSWALGWCPTISCTPAVSFTQLVAFQPVYLSFLFAVFFFLWDLFAIGLNELLRK